MKDEDRRRGKGKINRMKKNSKNCKKQHAPNIALRRQMLASIVIYVTNNE